MTTIVADVRTGEMASDTFWFDDEQCGSTRKVFRVRGALIGGAGPSKQLGVWLERYRASKPLVGDAITIMRLSASGIDCWTQVDGWHRIEAKHFAIGTGSMAARGAMAAGSTCARAVRIACDIDASSGGPVRTYRLAR